MAKPHFTASLPSGTQINHDGTEALKIYPSAHEPFPWLAEGTRYSDEWASRLIVAGATVLNGQGRRIICLLADGYRAAEISTGNLIHAAGPGDTTMCGRKVYAFVDVARWPVECPRCIKSLDSAPAAVSETKE